MPKKIKQRTFDEILTELRNRKFDVREASGVANGYQVSKYGAAAVITKAQDGSGTAFATKPGFVWGGEIAHLLDRGFQKFLKTSKVELPATAERLKAVHSFAEELKEVTGAISLYNESLGSVSDEYMYDRVKGRDLSEGKPLASPWGLPVGH